MVVYRLHCQVHHNETTKIERAGIYYLIFCIFVFKI